KGAGCKQSNPVSGRHECEHCHKVFSFSQGLRRHKWKCEGSRIWPCSYCDKYFYRSDHLKIHQKSYHENSFLIDRI
ncbi:unnamed protein product, partial [Lymnaea stagnalis]